MQYVADHGRVGRAINVLKVRGSDHDKDIRGFTIDDSGMQIGERLTFATGTSCPRRSKWSATAHDVELVDDRTAIVTLRSAAVRRAGDDVAARARRPGAEGINRMVIDLRNPQMLNSKVLDALVRGAAGLDPRRGAGSR